MIPAIRISRTTFFAAAALVAAAAVPAHAYLFEDEIIAQEPSSRLDYNLYDDYKTIVVNNLSAKTFNATLLQFLTNGNGYKTFVKMGRGLLTTTGWFDILNTQYLYNGHAKHTIIAPDNHAHYSYITTLVDNVPTGIPATPADYRYSFGNSSSGSLLNWKGGELVVDSGTLGLVGYVNAWFDFGTRLNEHYLGTSEGQMTGVSVITVRDGATLELSGNVNFTNRMVADTSLTTFQFLRNLRAGDLGTSVDSTLRLGTSTAFHVNIHIDGWSENERIDTGVSDGEGGTVYSDSALAFGGSIGQITGAGNIYKTGDGAFTILGSNPGFEGSIYAAGGQLVLAAEDNNEHSEDAGSFETLVGTGLKAYISSSIGNVESVNIAGEDAGQGSVIRKNEHVTTATARFDDNETIARYSIYVKESYFTTPDVGTLVIATNQKINNFQSYFAAGHSVRSIDDTYYPATGKTYKVRVEDVVTAAKADTESDGVLATTSGSMTGTSDAPIIAGTGESSYLVVAGANYTVTEENGEKVFTAITDSDGYVKGGVLVINQEAGKGGVYKGSIVGARAKIYNKTKFAADTEDSQSDNTTSNATRLEDALATDDEITAALQEIYRKEDVSTELAAFNALKSSDGSFALDTELAIDIADHFQNYNNTTAASYYVEYTADDNVRGGTLVLDGAGDLALLFKTANYSGIYVAATRTGKTVLNVASLNALEGQTLSLGNGGAVSFVIDISETFRAKLSGFGENSSLTFAVAEDISVISNGVAGNGNVIVGNTRAASLEFEYVQEDVKGTVYVERGVTLDLNTTTDVFPNAKAIVLHQGDTGAEIQGSAAPGLYVSTSQTVNNLTGDDTSQLWVNSGTVLTLDINSNDSDSASGLNLGTYNGTIYGNGSIVKGGAKTLTIGGGANAGYLSGTIEIGEGNLVATAANSFTNASSLILNGVTATMTGDQALRTLYGTGTVSVSGTLTLGANAAPESAADRFYYATNLGTATDGTHLSTEAGTVYAPEKSFERFVGNYDKEGNVVLTDDTLPTFTSQADATTAYLTATGKLAYSGFDVSSLETFKDAGILSESDYNNLVAAAESGTWNDSGKISVTVDSQASTTVTVSKNTLLTGLGEVYTALNTKATYEDYFYRTTKGTPVYSAYGKEGKGTQNNNKLRSLYISVYGSAAGKSKYDEFIKENVTDKTTGVMEYSDLVAEYDKIIDDAKEIALDKIFTTTNAAGETVAKTNMTLAEAKALFSAFYSVKNLGGTAIYSEEEFLKEFGDFDFSKSTDATGTLTDENVAKLREKYSELCAERDVIAAKENFAGIEITGAFANDVTTDGELVAEWASDLSFSGNITAGNFIKTGDNTITLTGTLSTGTLVVSGGVLKIESSTLASTLSGGITIDRGATLYVNADTGVSATFAQTVLGLGNFVKTGEGTLVLSDNVRYFGTTEIEGGTLQLRLRNSIAEEDSDTGETVLPQGNITFTGDDTTLVLAQGDDEDDPVTWDSTISSATDVSGVSIEKTGAATLTVSGDVSLGDTTSLTVSGGTLNLTGEVSLGANSAISIASGAAFALSNSTVTSTTFDGDGAFRVIGVDSSTTGAVSVAGTESAFAVGANGTTSAYETAFTGTVTIGSTTLRNGQTITATTATLTLSGESAFPYASGIVINSGSTLEVASGTQAVRALSGAGTVSIASGATLEVERNGDRLATDYSTGYYAYNESAVIDAPNFAGTVSGDGTLVVSGNGLSRFTGAVSVANVSVDKGGQAIIDVSKFTGSVVVGSNTVLKDDAGRKIVAQTGEKYLYDATGKTFSTAADTDSFALKIRTIKTTGGVLVDVDTAGISLKTETTEDGDKSLYYVENGDRVYVDSVTEWDYVSEENSSEYVVNWALVKKDENGDPEKDANGNVIYITGSALAALISVDPETQSVSIKDGYDLAFYQLSETGTGAYVASTGTSDALASEVIFTVAAGTKADLGSGTGSFSFTGENGKFGKVGDGTLNVAGASTAFENCAAITVYNGTLHLDEWVATDKYIVEDATLEIELGTSTSVDYTTIMGSGTFAVTADANKTISIVSSAAGDDETSILPTSSSDGKFFNGVYLFKNPESGSYTVTVRDVSLPGIGTESNVDLSLNNVTILQTQNSEIAGSLSVENGLTISGTQSDGSSGNVLSENLRILTMSGEVTSSVAVVVKNVGFGFSLDDAKTGTTSVAIDNTSRANAFFIESNSDGDGSVGSSVKIYAVEDEFKNSSLRDFSIVKTGTGVVTYDIAAVLESTQELAEGDVDTDYFGITYSVYDALSENSGTLNLGVSQGKLVVSNLEKALSSNGTLLAYNSTLLDPVNVNLVALRSATEAAAGTLVFETASATSTTSGVSLFDATDSTNSTAATLAETIRGGGNVIFNQKALTVSAAQKYFGQTLISADTTLAGDGRSLASSFVQVASGASLSGGVVLAARNVAYSVTAARGETDTGLAGETTLTITLDDARLGSDLKCALTISEDGTAVKESSLQELGSGVEGVSIDSASYDSKSGVLTLSVTDKAYAKEGSETETIGSATGEFTTGDSYEIKIDLSTAIPSAANASKTSSGTTSVASDFQLDSGGSLSLDAAAGDKVDVGSGTIVLNGATIVENLNDSVRGKTLTLFNASSISRVYDSSSYTGTSAVVDSLSEGNDDLSDAGESTMKLLVYTDSATGAVCARMITDNFSEVSAGYNDAASGSFLDALSAAARNGRNASARILINGDSVSGDARTLLFALNGLTTDQLGEEVTKLSPAAFGSMLAMPLAAFNSDISRLHARLDQRRYDGADPLRESNEYEFFALAQSDFAENDDASDTPTFDYNLYGATAGFDWKPDYSTTLGVAVGYTYGKAKIHHDGGKINMDDMRITAFASHLFGNSYIEYGLQGGIGSFDIKRNTIAGKTSGDADSYFGGAFITVGSIYTIYNDVKTGEGLYFTPNFGLSGFYEKIDAFKESGAGGLDMDSSDGTGLRARLAAGIQWATPVGELMSARFGAEIAYSHEFLADELDMDGRFSAMSGTKFSATANAAASDVFSFSPTIDLLISEKTSVYLGYGIEFSTDSGISQNVNAGFRHRF